MQLLDQREAARLLRLSERTLERLRLTGGGPLYIKCGRSVRYRAADLEKWIAARGKRKTEFDSFGLKISYETASVYLRIWEHWADIKWLAVQKSVDPTLLTIDGARELWARRKDTEEDDTEDAAEGDGKPTVEAMEARQAANAEAEAAELADDDVDVDAERRQRVDRTLAVLMRTYPQDELLDLTERLAKHLGMTLMPLDTMTALAETLSLTPIDDVSANVSVGVDAE